jgi:glycosyltransferase involved in cell wall biosynthesis
MGRQMGYLIDSWAAHGGPETIVVDSRGPGRAMWSPIYLARAVARTGWLIASRRVELVHVNVSVRGSVFRKLVITALARALGCPVVLHLHSGRFIEFFDGLPGGVRWLIGRMFRSAQCTVVLGTKWRRHIVDRVGVPAGRVEILRNAVPQPSTSIRMPHAGPCRILFLGNLSALKGVGELLAALSGDAMRARGWVLRMAGGGAVAEYQAQAEALGLARNIEFLGWVGREQVGALLEWADIMVLPSHTEGLPLSVLEALGAGVPVVVTAVGAIPDFIRDGESGLIVQPRDVADLAHALGRLIDAPELRRKLAAGGRALFASEFSVERYAERMVDIYRRHCLGPRGIS